MAQQIKQLTIQAPGFFGINTQDSPVGINPNFASVANNCVIDKQGRIGARKGLSRISNADVTKNIETIFEATNLDGAVTLFSTGNNKIYKGDTTLTELGLPNGYSILANNWKIVNLANKVYFFQTGHVPLVYTTGTSVVANTNAPQGNEALAAFGRVWVTDTASDKSTIHFSDDLDGTTWKTIPKTETSSAGDLDVREVWTSGADEIVSLQAHNGFLIIFGRHEILIYKNPDDVITEGAFSLSDTIEGVGCIDRDSIQNIGTDILFLSDTGVRSLGRVIQEKSLPMRNVSKNIRNDVLDLITQETLPIKSAYSTQEAFYLLTFPTSNTVLCFDIRSPLEDGTYRATTWSEINPKCFCVRKNGDLLIGKLGGIYKYFGFNDTEVVSGVYQTTDYDLRYFSNPMNFGNSSNIKFLKKLKIRVIGNNSSETVLNWAYDYSTNFNKQLFVNTNQQTNLAEYGISEFGQVGVDFTQDINGNTVTGPSAEYSGGLDLQNPEVNGTGSGTVLTIGLETTINGAEYSIQQIDLSVLLGRTI
jgi:hypothetical protein